MRITIIGPRSVGKTTTCTLLAKHLGYTHEESDRVMDLLLAKHGGLGKVLREKRMELIDEVAMQRLSTALHEDDLIFDLAGGALNLDGNQKPTLGEQTASYIRKRSKVIGLLPCKDDQQAIAFLYERERARPHFDPLKDDELKEKVAKDYEKTKDKIERAAHHLIYVKGKTPERIVEEIEDFLKTQAKAL